MAWLNKIATKVKDDPIALLVYVYLCIPLIYITGNGNLTRTLRYIVLIGILVVCLAFPVIIRNAYTNFNSLSKKFKYALGLMSGLMLISAFMGERRSPFVVLVGSVPDYFGLAFWVVVILIGLLFADRIRKIILSFPSLIIFGLACLFSLTGEFYYIIRGFRVAGVMYHPTSLSIFACVTILLAMHQLNTNKHVKYKTLVAVMVLAVATTILITSQSRIGYIIAIVSLGVWSITVRKSNKSLALLSIIILLVLAWLPTSYPGYFSRFQSSSVDRGVSYRLDLYKTSAQDISINNKVFGNGPNSLPRAINNKDSVSEAVAKSLDDGYTFVSTHDMYFDLAYYFGSIFAVMLIALSLAALIKGILEAEYTISLIFLALIGNALVNVPSIELSSLYFIILISLLILPKPNSSKFRPSTKH